MKTGKPVLIERFSSSEAIICAGHEEDRAKRYDLASEFDHVANLTVWKTGAEFEYFDSITRLAVKMPW
jgi:hypothetical protein